MELQLMDQWVGAHCGGEGGARLEREKEWEEGGGGERREHGGVLSRTPPSES